MRKLFKSLVPILLVISLIFTLGVESISGSDLITQTNTKQEEAEAPPKEEVKEEIKEEPNEEVKEPIAEEIKEEPVKEEVQENPKEEAKENPKEKPKEETEEPQVPEETGKPEVSETPEVPEAPETPEDPEGVIVPGEVEGPTATLIINHLERYNNELDVEYKILAEEIVEGLEIGSSIDPLKYIKEFEGLVFLQDQTSELILVEGENELKLYYEFDKNIGEIDSINDEVGEAPDFPPGEGIEIESPYIQTFSPGQLGPLKEESFSNMSKLNLMNLQSYPDEINNKAWPQPGSLKINKTGEPVAGTGNQFEIKLEIEGKNRVETSDIVLVIDRSGSMKGNRLTNAKTAAISFVNTMLSDPNNTSTRIAIVSFAGGVTINQQFTGYSGKNALIFAINGLNANGGTNIQAGIRQGSAVLAGSSANNKSIVFLGDGGATYSYEPKNPNSYLENWKTVSGVNYYRTRTDIPQTGFDYGSVVGTGNNEYFEYESSWWYSYSNNYRHGAHAVAEAGFAPADQNIYTIALGAGTEGEWTLQNMSNSGYYSTADPANLTQIYGEIAGNISNAATNAVVTDPLGDMYDILGINSSNYNSLITVSHGTLSWDTATEKITWTIGTISQGTIYWMKYKVALDYSAEGGVLYPANKPTYISYKNIDKNNGKKYFPIPEFRLRELKITKILNNGKAGDENKKFDITLEGPAGPYKKTWSVSLKAGESKKIKGLLAGTYTVRETVPMNFKLVGISSSSQLVIGENAWKTQVSVTNKRSNDGWFWHDPDPKINSFTVATAGTKKAELPDANKSLYGKVDYFVIPRALEKEHKL